MFEKIKIAAGITAFIALVSFNPTHAYAAPDTGSGGAQIESADDPREVGAKIEDGSGNRASMYDTPADKPSRGDYASDADYRTAVSLWEAGERGRIANKAMSK